MAGILLNFDSKGAGLIVILRHKGNLYKKSNNLRTTITTIMKLLLKSYLHSIMGRKILKYLNRLQEGEKVEFITSKWWREKIGKLIACKRGSGSLMYNFSWDDKKKIFSRTLNICMYLEQSRILVLFFIRLFPIFTAKFSIWYLQFSGKLFLGSITQRLLGVIYVRKLCTSVPYFGEGFLL